LPHKGRFPMQRELQLPHQNVAYRSSAGRLLADRFLADRSS
jgi:hypothetical protein